MSWRPVTFWRRKPTGGFTLLEILVATVIGAFVAMSAATALRSVISCREKIVASTTISAELRFVADIIRKDFLNFYRHSDLNNTKLIGLSALTDYGPADDVVFYTVNRVKARPDQPEGDVYEVEYSLIMDPDEDRPYLIRRVWPNPVSILDLELPPAGVVTVLSDKIVMFDILYFYQEQWLEDWTEEMEELPELISVGLAIQPEGRTELLNHNFFINFARWPGGEAGGSGIMMEGSAPVQPGSEATPPGGAAGPGGING